MYVMPTSIWYDLEWILQDFRGFCEFRGISRIYLKFAAPRPRKISEALIRRQITAAEKEKGKKKEKKNTKA